MSSCQNINNDAKYWHFLVISGIIILIIVILVMVLTMEGAAPKEQPKPSKCKSAEYPTIAENISCDPNVVEVSLTASDNEVQILNGDPTKLYNYNKSFPGPLIEAKKGDTLIVHFFNDICEPTTITWHGLLTPANMDGSQISSFPIMPGDSFDYEFPLLNSGLFWYHSDINSREQVQKGLYGVILVKDYDEDSCYSLPENEKVLAFSDLNLNSSNQVDIEFSSNQCERISQQINGIVGNVLLTNGVFEGCIDLAKNEPIRLYLVNCATDRFMKIFLEGHDMLRIGGDQGLLEKPILIKEENGLMLTTGERAEIVFVPRKEQIKLYTSANPRGTQKVISDECGNCELTDDISKSDEKLLLVTFNVYEEKEECSQLEVPLELKKIKRIKVDHCTPVIPVYYGNYLCDDVEYFAFRVNKKGVPFQNLRSKDAPIVFEDGIYIIEVTNTSPLANNFYLHGFTFQHIDTLLISDCNKERIVNHVLENKDTIYIPAKPCGKRSKTVVRLAVKFTSKCRNIIAFGKEPTEKRSGGWIFQSHILTNANLGQEGFIQIVGKCERDKYLSHSGYLDSYSKYSDSRDYSTCLTRHSKSSQTDLSSTLEELTQSLITCKCGSGVNASLCSCSLSSLDSSDLSSSDLSSIDLSSIDLSSSIDR
jgi:FtsP/CotA-like multicopper oxidase with cupredoxin domain